MKAVKCNYTSGSVPLTKGKIYDVINFVEDIIGDSSWVRIVDDNGEPAFYYLNHTDGTWFVDATADIREEKLNKILLYNEINVCK